MTTEEPGPNTEALRAAVMQFANSRVDDYFKNIPPHVLETMTEIAVDTLLIPREKLHEEALKADRDIAKVREELKLRQSTPAILEASTLETHLKQIGHYDQETINKLTDNSLRKGIAEKRARLAVLNAFQVGAPAGQGLGNAPVDFCWQAVNNAISLL